MKEQMKKTIKKVKKVRAHAYSQQENNLLLELRNKHGLDFEEIKTFFDQRSIQSLKTHYKYLIRVSQTLKNELDQSDDITLIKLNEELNNTNIFLEGKLIMFNLINCVNTKLDEMKTFY